MRDFGAMMSFDVGSHDAARTLLNSVKLCTLASSLGGIETIVQHSVSMTAAKVPREQRERAGITEGLIRLSVGIEDADDIIADLEQGLRKVAGSK
jgi:methionine-gamma-lyase